MTFDTDVVVSVFETNIRIMGGLVGGYVAATHFKQGGIYLQWYQGELLGKARGLGNQVDTKVMCLYNGDIYFTLI